jgi:type 1 fimbriae regulatory protein FimB/type 1 fimbriae regulatory protein FimE
VDQTLGRNARAECATECSDEQVLFGLQRRLALADPQQWLANATLPDLSASPRGWRLRLRGLDRDVVRDLVAGSTVVFVHDTRSLQAYLGHSNIQHTIRYTELAPDRFKDFWKEQG